MKKNIIYSLICVIFPVINCSFLVQDKTAEISKAMYQLEETYIPVDYFVQKGNMIGAKRAILSLSREWDKFNNRFSKMKSTEDWQSSFLRMNDRMTDLYNHINANNIESSETALFYFRYELTDLRCRHHIRYYFDFLHSFGDSWRVAQYIAEDDKMCLYEWNEFELFIASAKRDWAIVELQSLPIEEMQLTDEELLVLMIKREKVSKLLQDFKEILSCGDQGLLTTKMGVVEDAYLDFLRQFGVFSLENTQVTEIF